MLTCIIVVPLFDRPEYDEERVVGSVNIPIINATKKFNTETKERELIQGKKNEKFLGQNKFRG